MRRRRLLAGDGQGERIARAERRVVSRHTNEDSECRSAIGIDAVLHKVPQKPLLPALALACLGLACGACGGSATSSSTTAVTAPTSSVASTPASTSATVTTATTSDTVPAAAPAVGTTLGSAASDEAVIANADGQGFSILTHDGTLTAYDSGGAQEAALSSADFDAGCGVLDVNVPGTGRALITQSTVNQPAEGLTPAQTTLELEAWSAQTGNRLWTAVVGHANGDSGFCGPSENDLGAAAYLAATNDGRWIVVNPSGAGGVVVNAATGATRSDRALAGTLGDFVLDRLPRPGDQGTARLTLPSTGAVAGSFHAYGNGVDLYSNANYGVDYALKGSFHTSSDSDSPPSGLSSDGHRLLTWQKNSIGAYALPSMRQLWRTTTDSEGTGWWLYGDGGGVAVVGKMQPSGIPLLEGLDDTTGRRLWQVTQGSLTYCGISNSEVQIDVNGDFTNLDVRTGQQVAYHADNGADCPTILAGGISVDASGDIVQTLDP